MSENQQHFVAVEQLRVGMYIELGLGWMSHPFPSGNFKISTERQIETIRTLGLQRVRYLPSKSDPVVAANAVSTSSERWVEGEGTANATGGPASGMPQADGPEVPLSGKSRAERIAYQQQSLAACERQFSDALRQYRKTVEQVSLNPQLALKQTRALVSSFVNEMLDDGDSAIRLLSEGVGERASLHPVNVSIISLLLGKAINLSEPEMLDLGLAAFLHDIGKSQLPDRVRWLQENFTATEYELYQEHVAESLKLGRRMGLSEGALLPIAQHHELVDGTGFPARLKGESLNRSSKILALVNRYENLCNPGRATPALTPHEALQHIFAQLKSRFDGATLSAFIRMMGVYPPGSVVQLVDGRHAIVVSVNSSRPLKPRVIVHEPDIPKEEALILDLERTPTVGIRRSLKPASLPQDAFAYLSPRSRMCYFFERATEAETPGATA
jgi:HD-GYP domain-containing protein (c-di-GMP phosphodiesterase class II)